MEMKFEVFAAAAIAAAGCFGDGGIPRWISVMPLPDGKAEELAMDAADQGNTTFIDGIVWSCTVNPEGDPVADKAAIYASRYRETSAVLRKMSKVKQGILLQATMGHGGFPGSITPWQLAVKTDGTSVYRMCPLDRRFLDYVAKACRTFAAEKPDFFMVDDDTRLIWGIPGCFCPLHLADFAKRTGREWTREEVVAMLEKGDSREAAIWYEAKRESLRVLFRTIRENFGGEIPGMLCVVGNEEHVRHAREFAQILAAPGQTPVVRGSGAPYHGKNLLHVLSSRSYYAWQLDTVGAGDVIYMQESDTCPHTLWATSAVRTLDHIVMLALDGCKGAKIWITRTSNYHEKKSAAAYRRMFREYRGLVEWATKADFQQGGVVVPPVDPIERNFGDRYLGLVGIPHRFGKARAGEVTAVSESSLKLLTPDAIREILSGRVIADGSAAIWLSKNGYSEDIGVKAKPWNRKTIQIHELDGGLRQAGLRTNGLADLTDKAAGARELTRLYNRPRMGDEPVYEAPGSILFSNARGGTVLSFAQPLPPSEPCYFEATLLSESYRDAMVHWLSLLCGGVPGGVCYLGVGPVTCLAGTTGDGENIVVLNALDIDGDDCPELMFERAPSAIERLQGDGSWANVAFEKTKSGGYRLSSAIRTQLPAIFRYRSDARP